MKNYAIGIDIGGTNTVMGLVNRDGAVVAQLKIKTQDYPDFDNYIAAVAAEIRQLAGDKLEEDVNGVGIGAPNGNYYTGCIEFAPNLPWKGGNLPLAKSLSEALGVPVTVTNDANAAALGEMAYGAAKGMKHFIMLTLGTGLGSGIVVDGKMVYGADGFAGELGHVVIDWSPNARQCGCGRRGCLETYCSATGIARTARMLLSESNGESLMRGMHSDELSSYDVYKAAAAGDKLALEVFERTGRTLGRAIANFVTFSAPEAVILFGGPTAAGDILMEPVHRHMEENLTVFWKGKIKLLLSQLDGGNAAVLGASALAW